MKEQHIHNSSNAQSAEDRLLDAGYEDIVCFSNYSYDDALIGVSDDGRAVYDYNKMVKWLMDTQGFSEIDAIEWVDYNTLRAIPYMDDKAPIVIYPV